MSGITRKTVLVVDDYPDVRLAFQAVLNYDGYHVLGAENGLEAVEAARDFCPHLILMDIDMPIMDGFEAAQQLKEHPGTRDIPIIALTARDFTDGDPRRFLFSGYIQKPVRANRLKEAVKQLIGDT